MSMALMRSIDEKASTIASKASGGPRSVPELMASAADMAAGAAKHAYAAAMGGQAGKQAGKESK